MPADCVVLTGRYYTPIARRPKHARPSRSAGSANGSRTNRREIALIKLANPEYPLRVANSPE
jgi:hypothetical protein